MIEFIKKVLGIGNEAQLKPLMKQADAIEALADTYAAMTDEQLTAKTEEFKARYQKGETLDALLPEAFATVR